MRSRPKQVKVKSILVAGLSPNASTLLPLPSPRSTLNQHFREWFTRWYCCAAIPLSYRQDSDRLIPRDWKPLRTPNYAKVLGRLPVCLPPCKSTPPSAPLPCLASCLQLQSTQSTLFRVLRSKSGFVDNYHKAAVAVADDKFVSCVVPMLSLSHTHTHAYAT